jgi:hypothetical protein
VSWEFDIALPPVPVAREPDEPYGPDPGPGGDPHEPPKVELRARARGGLWLRIGQGHFISTYEGVLKRRRTNPQRVRDRDGGWCTVPGCSAHSDDAHHIEYRSRGGHPTALWNQTGGCRFHHGCVHDVGLRLEGKAPDALVWTLDEEPFTGQ